MTRRKNFLFSFFALILFPLLFIVFLEGTCSFYDVMHQGANINIAERIHTRYDPDLGWSNIPSFYVKDMYGKGVYLQTNAQGFRNRKTFDSKVAPGKTRIICSGDSFTLGYGMNNDSNWCQLLEGLDSHFETVNMGQGGYGLDQVYLWYLRDGIKLDHQIQVLTLISDDLQRLGTDKFWGYSKPYFELVNGTLKLRNVPVPKKQYHLMWLRVLNDFKLVQFLNRLKAAQPKISNFENARLRQMALKIIEDLDRINRAKNSRLVIVYIPWRKEISLDTQYDKEDISFGLREFFSSELAKRKILFIDFYTLFEQLPLAQTKEMYRWHLSEKGNQYVAQEIYRQLSK